MDFVTVSTGLILPYWMGLPIRYIQLIEYHSGDCERNDVLEELKEISYNTQNNNVISVVRQL